MGAPFSTLVDAATLAAHLEYADWRVFDCRHNLARPDAGQAAWAAGHIPDALFAHLDRDLSGPMTGRNGRHPLPDVDAFVARLCAWGVGNETQVVAYDDLGGTFAVRLWWMLRWLGHTRVAVLDGGLAAWQAAGLPLSAAPPAPVQPAAFVPLAPQGAVMADWVAAHTADPATLLLDARSPDRYRGENETLDPVAGHIPGSRNRFFRDNLGADGRFLPAARLRVAFAPLLAGRAPQQVMHCCGSGVTACHNLLAMEIAGLHGSRIYPGSWSEWCADPARPVATGAEP